MTNTTQSSEKAAPVVVLPVHLRDYFAAKAMQAFIPVQCGEWPGDEVIARYAYEVADAMLKVRAHD